ncbi:MAG: hypothetical protein P4L59_15710 [Desulfosporosinus sp.]|nr:hypothetical protein [Desulfosporosinus sp.]
MMRIERITGTNLAGLGDVDLIFPIGPVLLFSKERSRQRMLGNLLLELFYNLKSPLASKEQSLKGLVEVWVSSESSRFHINRQYFPQNDGLEQSSKLAIEDETGQKVSLPATMTLGEHLFGVKLRAFHQGGVLNWPENKGNIDFSQRVRNIRQGGDEGLSLPKARASLAGAQSRVKEQTQSMALVKAEYNALRRDWEEAHCQQEKERLLVIEIKNLQEKEKILVEKISQAVKIQERLAVLRQNPDYRELRQLQGEVTRLEERTRELEANLTALTRESQVDWAVIEGLREECREWAGLQEHVERLATAAQLQTQKIHETQTILLMSGYQGLSENEVQRLRLAEEERYAAQEKLEQELDNLTIVKSVLEKKQIICTKEIAKLQGLAVMAGVTAAAENKIAQRERYLEQWQSSSVGSFLDRVLRKQLGVTSIAERLSLRSVKYFQDYNASNFKEFTSQLQEFRNQSQLVERLEMELEQLQEKVRGEEKLHRIVNSRSKILLGAFSKAKVSDFPAWLSGWEDYQRKKHQLTLWQVELELKLEQQKLEETKMAASAEQLREKLGDWGTLTTDRDEVLAAVLNVARQLWAKDETEKEVAVFSQKYYDLLGARDIDYLAKILEPLADLEREMCLSAQDGLVELAARQKERVEIRRQLEATEQSLHDVRKFPSLSVLEKKIEPVKRQWMAYEALHNALDGAQALLENSWQEWKTKYGKTMDAEKQWILSQMSALSVKGKIEKNGAEGKRDYFAYRMAIAQLALRANTEVPLFFSVGEMNEGQGFWEEVLEYLRKLSLSRQVVFGTSDAKLWQKLGTNDWQRLVV